MKKYITTFIFRHRLAAAIAAQFAQAVAFTSVASAETPNLPGLNVTTWKDLLGSALCPIAGAMFYIFIAITVIVVVYAAWRYLTSGGDEEKVRTANRTLTYAAIAVVVALLAKGFPLVIRGIFEGNNTPGAFPSSC